MVGERDALRLDQFLVRHLTGCSRRQARLAIEAGISWFWRPLVGAQGDVLGVDRYGESAPAPAVFKYLGFTLENVLEKLSAVLK